MGNKQPEADLVAAFEKIVKSKKLPDDLARFALDEETNFNCKSQTHADVEYTTKEGICLVIEAKTDKSSDRYNTIHKLFGNLLRETGRNREGKTVEMGLLIPGDDEALRFYRSGFERINSRAYREFGKLVGCEHVFAVKGDNFGFGRGKVFWPVRKETMMRDVRRNGMRGAA